MATVTVTISGEQEALARIDAIPDLLEQTLSQGLTAIAFEARAEAQQSILKGSKTGKFYRRGGVTHQASAPGEAPANDTGALVRSILVEPGKDRLTIRMIARTAYAVFLEYGTRRMAARPFLRPAALAAAARGPEILRTYVERALSSIRK